MNNEKLINKVEFDQNNYREIERKFVPKDPELFEQWKPLAVDITQLYLSELDDEYSLRLRRTVTPEGDERYVATTKNRGTISQRGLERLEVETPISKESFMSYAENNHYPALFKKRATICEGVTIDWIDGYETPIVEIENSDLFSEASDFLSRFENDLSERTGEPEVDNEHIAHELSEHTPEREQTVSAQEIIEDILTYRAAGIQKLVIGIGGRSGSGKSTLAKELSQLIERHPQLHEIPSFFSTDDYHRGRTYLESTYGAPWTNWEDARVYDTKTAAEDVKRLLKGEPVQRRRFDFGKEEVVYESLIEPSDIVIIEGIHASSRDLASTRTMYYEVKTPVSVALGRDLTRLMTTDRPSGSIATPESRLKYIIEIGEPTYQTIETAPRNVFSGCIRPLGKQALTTLKR